MHEKRKKILSIALICFFFHADGSFSWYATIPFSVARTILSDVYRQSIEEFQEIPYCAYPLPLSYQKFNAIRIRHFQSIVQRGDSCGWYAVCNARAIDNLVKNSSALHAQSIQQEAKKVIADLELQKTAVMSAIKRASFFDGITSPQASALAKYLSVYNCYMLSLTPKKNWMQWNTLSVSNDFSPYVNPSKTYRGRYCVKSPKRFLKKTISDQKVTHYYISAPAACDDNDLHAVLVSVILSDKKNGKPMVIYQDSNNCMIGEEDAWIMYPLLHTFFKVLNSAFDQN